MQIYYCDGHSGHAALFGCLWSSLQSYYGGDDLVGVQIGYTFFKTVMQWKLGFQAILPRP